MWKRLLRICFYGLYINMSSYLKTFRLWITFRLVIGPILFLVTVVESSEEQTEKVYRWERVWRMVVDWRKHSPPPTKQKISEIHCHTLVSFIGLLTPSDLCENVDSKFIYKICFQSNRSTDEDKEWGYSPLPRLSDWLHPRKLTVV